MLWLTIGQGWSLCIPPFSPDPGCAGQDQDGRASSASGGPILAQTTLVQPSPVPVVWDTLATSPETGPAVSGWGDSVTSEATPPQSVGLATERHQWSMLGLQEGVMNTMQRARALVITTAYQLRWRLSCSRYSGIEVVPESCGVQYVFQYMQSRLDEGLAASTPRGYLAAISACHAG